MGRDRREDCLDIFQAEHRTVTFALHFNGANSRRRLVSDRDGFIVHAHSFISTAATSVAQLYPLSGMGVLCQ
jgi:hypothetical protein